MQEYTFNNHRLLVKPNSIPFSGYSYYLFCLKKDSSRRAQELDVYNKFPEEYKFCPYCGEFISPGVKHFFKELKLN